MKSVTLNISTFLRRSHLFILLTSWILAVPLAILIRFDGDLSKVALSENFFYSLIASFINFVLISSFALRGKLRNSGNWGYLVAISAAALITGLVLLLIRVTFNYPDLPRSISIISPLISWLAQFSFTSFYDQENPTMKVEVGTQQRVLIYGAGKLGIQLAEQLMEHQDIYLLVGFIDDDGKKFGKRVLGSRVLGNYFDLPHILNYHSIDILLVAISELDAEKLKHLNERGTVANVIVRIVPNKDSIISGVVGLTDTIELNPESILGRTPISYSSPNTIQQLKNSTVLITGAAGSIGSEIARQLNKYGYEKAYLLDRDENGLLRTKLSIDLSSDLSDERIVLCDIRDSQKIEQIISSLKPKIIFHAAALKHVSTLERFPEEAFKTNVQGTLNLWKSAVKCGVPYFVNISSDKAADPTTQLGKTKLFTERIVASTESQEDLEKYISVRFGNVIGSNGSFVEVFRNQIEKGGPVTVRHPDASRFFMTTAEAVQLVFQSLDVAEHGETLILDMGRPVKISDIARQMIRASGKNIDVIYTGLNPGEKLHESLVSTEELIETRKHPKIMHTRVDSLKQWNYEF